MDNYDAAWAEISLSALLKNLKIVKEHAGENTDVGAVVKADAYGLGAKEIVRALCREECIKMFIVGKLSEAEDILLSAKDKSVLVLDRIKPGAIKDFNPGNIIYSAYDRAFMQELEELGAAKNSVFSVHIRVDVWESGMGFSPEDVNIRLFDLPHVKVKGIYTHLHSSYQFDWEKTEKELCRFDRAVDRLPLHIHKKLTIHAQNSPLIFTHPHHGYNMVRSGTALYGLPCHPKHTYGLTPILSLKSRIVIVTDRKEGCSLSYQQGGKGTDGKIARFLFGYWDCPFLMTMKDIKVWIKGKLYSVSDEPCMDNSCIDVKDGEVSIGDEVILMGEKEGVRLGEIMVRHNIDLVHSEHLYILSKRLHKIYKS